MKKNSLFDKAVRGLIWCATIHYVVWCIVAIPLTIFAAIVYYVTFAWSAVVEAFRNCGDFNRDLGNPFSRKLFEYNRENVRKDVDTTA